MYIYKLLIFTVFLLAVSCDHKPATNEKIFLPKMKFKKTKNPNYSNYFPSKEDSIGKGKITHNQKMNLSEPIPSFNSKPISNKKDLKIEKNNSKGFFSYFFGPSKKNQQQSEEKLCSELLNINKTVLTEQNNELALLKNEKKNILQELNKKEKQFQREKNQNQIENKRLKKEIERLNSLIKILSREIE